MLADHAEFYGVIRTIAEPGIPRGGLGLGGRFRAWSVERYFKKILKKDQGQAVFISALPATTDVRKAADSVLSLSPSAELMTRTVWSEAIAAADAHNDLAHGLEGSRSRSQPARLLLRTRARGPDPSALVARRDCPGYRPGANRHAYLDSGAWLHFTHSLPAVARQTVKRSTPCLVPFPATEFWIFPRWFLDRWQPCYWPNRAPRSSRWSPSAGM